MLQLVERICPSSFLFLIVTQGLAACAAGFVIQNNLLIVAGALVGASGIILTQIMCKAMNRKLSNVLFSGFSSAGGKEVEIKGEVNPISVDDTYLILEAAKNVCIVPGYGMAVAQAQHAVRELSELLEENGCEVNFAIHPAARPNARTYECSSC